MVGTYMYADAGWTLASKYPASEAEQWERQPAPEPAPVVSYAAPKPEPIGEVKGYGWIENRSYQWEPRAKPVERSVSLIDRQNEYFRQCYMDMFGMPVPMSAARAIQNSLAEPTISLDTETK